MRFFIKYASDSKLKTDSISYSIQPTRYHFKYVSDSGKAYQFKYGDYRRRFKFVYPSRGEIRRYRFRYDNFANVYHEHLDHPFMYGQREVHPDYQPLWFIYPLREASVSGKQHGMERFDYHNALCESILQMMSSNGRNASVFGTVFDLSRYDLDASADLLNLTLERITPQEIALCSDAFSLARPDTFAAVVTSGLSLEIRDTKSVAMHFSDSLLAKLVQAQDAFVSCDHFGISRNDLCADSDTQSVILSLKYDAKPVSVASLTLLQLSGLKDAILHHSLLLSADSLKDIVFLHDSIHASRPQQEIDHVLELLAQRHYSKEASIQQDTLSFFRPFIFDGFHENPMLIFPKLIQEVENELPFKWLERIVRRETAIIELIKKLERAPERDAQIEIRHLLDRVPEHSGFADKRYMTAVKGNLVLRTISYLTMADRDRKRLVLPEDIESFADLLKLRDSAVMPYLSPAKRYSYQTVLKTTDEILQNRQGFRNAFDKLMFTAAIKGNKQAQIEYSCNLFQIVRERELQVCQCVLAAKESKMVNLESEREMNLWARLWFLNAESETDRKIVPYLDYPYEDEPLVFSGFSDLIPDNYNVVYPVNLHIGADKHPIPDPGFGNLEIPLAINIMIDIINILILMWSRFYHAFWGWTGTQAVLGITAEVLNWLTLETSQVEMDNKDCRQHYERCYRWIRWEAEKIVFAARNDMALNGNFYVGLLIEELINYMQDHHFDIMPLFDDVRKMDEWRRLFNRDLQTDIAWTLDKIKGVRHKSIIGKERKHNE